MYISFGSLRIIIDYKYTMISYICHKVHEPFLKLGKFFYKLRYSTDG